MRDELLLYYERELTFLRQSAAQFAEKYPKVASRLVLEPSQCEDPHVERLLEGFAFLAAKVHLKLDDEFPEITEAFLGTVYPHLIRPVPSMSIVQFHLDPGQGKLTTGYDVPRGSLLYSRPVGGTPCKFRTSYDTTLWPVQVSAADWKAPDRLQPQIRALDATGALRLELTSAADVPFNMLNPGRLRFYLDGESSLVQLIYELISCSLLRVVVRDAGPGARGRSVTLPAGCLKPVGFETDESVIDFPRRSFGGYRLLQEYFSFPEKFLFFEISGLEQAWGTGIGSTSEIILLIGRVDGEDRRQRLETGISANTFRLGCSPVINLFPQTAEPILLDQKKYEYQVIPDLRRQNATEIFSIEEVASIDPATKEVVTFDPFFSSRHSQRGKSAGYWVTRRRASNRPGDAGTEIFLSLVDYSMRPVRPDVDSLNLRTVCTNRDLPARLPFGDESGDFELEVNAPIKKIVALKKPTLPMRPPMAKKALWHLASHLSLNHLSLVEEGREALQHILRLYNFAGTASSEKTIEGIVTLQSRPRFARVVSDNGISFARGTRVEMELDESQFVGGGAYLFAAVLEQFLSQYATLNSFTQLVVRTRQRREVLREWQPRAGRKILL